MAINSVILKTISETKPGKQDGKIYGMWIIQYYDVAKTVSIGILRGEKKVKADNSIWYVGKAFRVEDFTAIKKVGQGETKSWWELLNEYQKNPPMPPKPVEPGATAACTDSVEEVPF